MKIVLIGSCGVGKTSILNRYLHDKYSPFQESTIGASYGSKKINLNINDKIIELKLEIWDTAGQERYKSLLPLYYRNADAIILTHDLNNSQTFEDIKNTWFPEISNTININDIQFYLVGCKLDLIKDINTIDKYSIQLENKQLLNHNISCRDNIGIQELFDTIIYDYLSINDKNIDNKINSNNLKNKYMKFTDTKPKYFYCF